MILESNDLYKIHGNVSRPGIIYRVWLPTPNLFNIKYVWKSYLNILNLGIKYSNIFGLTKFANRISKYIQKYENYESDIRIYSIGQNSIYIFKYWVSEEQYSNIQIYSNICPGTGETTKGESALTAVMHSITTVI